MKSVGNFIIRMIVGLAIIFLVNEMLASNGIEVAVGMNPVTALVSGGLGIPGVVLLYGIGIW